MRGYYITSEQEESLKEEYVNSIRIKLSDKKYLKEFNFNVDEW